MAERKISSAIHICVTCEVLGTPRSAAERSGKKLHDAVAALVESIQAPIDVFPVECMANCKRGCTVAFAAPRKWTYILGEIDPETPGIAEAILACAGLQSTDTEGIISYFARPEILRKGMIARVPPFAQMDNAHDR